MTGRTYDPVKRVLDVVLASIGLVLTFPLQMLVASLVRWKLGSPVIFRQGRPGRNEKVFELLKFRTMLEPNTEKNLVTDEQRMSSFGSFLRSTSLDELPTLWNVIKGEMSLVGPRPLLVCYLGRYSHEQHRRHEVRPGITGLAQVSGRNAISWEEKFKRDIEYVNNRGPLMDLKIMLRTLTKVVIREGISDGECVSMSEFGGAVRDR